MFPWYSAPQNDNDRGFAALTYFHNYSTANFSYGVSSVTELANIVGKGRGDIFLEGLGLQANSTEMSEGKVRDTMERLADQSRGQIPDRNSFFNAMTKSSSTITFMDWVHGAPEIATGIASDAVTMAQNVGEGVKSVASFVGSPIGILAIVAVLGVVGLGYLKLNKVI